MIRSSILASHAFLLSLAVSVSPHVMHHLLRPLPPSHQSSKHLYLFSPLFSPLFVFLSPVFFFPLYSPFVFLSPLGFYPCSLALLCRLVERFNRSSIVARTSQRAFATLLELDTTSYIITYS